MIRNVISALLGLAVIPLASAAQAPGSVHVVVVSDSGNPLPGARVTIQPSGRSLGTDRAGRSVISLPAGRYQLDASYPGYRRNTVHIDIRGGDSTEVTIHLAVEPAQLEEIVVRGEREPPALSTLPSQYGPVVLGGKKSEVIALAATPGNLAENNPRQVFARVPGIMVWELDGNGLQTNIAARGLNPHRSWEFLVAEDGRHINSDLYGYPEAHYNPPIEAVERIELVRGTGALSFGPQYGGYVNYVLKQGDPTRAVAYEAHQSAGAYGMFSSYNAIGGQVGKLNHYSYLDWRRRDGWRDANRYDWYSAHTGLTLALTPRAHLEGNFSWMRYVVQFGGGLNDAQFAEDPRQAPRTRNYFSPQMVIPSAKLSWDLSPATTLELTGHGIFGQRNSVQFIADPTVRDTVNPALGTHNPRQVDRDYYAGVSAEARLRTGYDLAGVPTATSVGLKLFSERTRRQQRGVGTVGSDFDLSLIQPGYPLDLNYYTRSGALFAEQMLTVTTELQVTGGVRAELIRTHFRGAIDQRSYTDEATRKQRTVALFGASARYQLGSGSRLHAAWSQAFRPILYSDLIPSGSIAVVDSTLKDSRGWNAEVGFRGQAGASLSFDVSLFALRYPNRVGTVAVGSGPGSYVLKTNVGTSLARGVESLVEWRPIRQLERRGWGFDAYASVAYDHARYTDGSIATSSPSGPVDTPLEGKKVEAAPEWIARSGATIRRNAVSFSLQHSFVSETYSDALNTESSASGAVGTVPAYHIFDLTAGWDGGRFGVRVGVTNLANKLYFTRRSTQYPGPGILPSDGRSVFVGVDAKLP